MKKTSFPIVWRLWDVINIHIGVGVVINTHRFGCMEFGRCHESNWFPPVLLATLMKQKFSNIQSGKRVLTNIPNNFKY